MTGTLRNLLVACGMLMLASPVFACSPLYHEATGKVLLGEACAAKHSLNGPYSAELFEARPWGFGKIIQKADVHNEYKAGDYYIVSDCQSKEVVVWGSEYFICEGSDGDVFDKRDESAAKLYSEIVLEEEIGEILTIDQIVRRARKLHVPEITLATTSSGLWFFDVETEVVPFSLACGCKTFFPHMEKWEERSE
ncbi:hypothetical protein [Neogemmobacter tilapiae]|uniref:Uncharacterized protein n=1 Tax=Neogemmobacter tilapiae TaxID=875041 RepID=A0A918TQL0_9RHOB|nr:hypothetical protein [Gemmobacter tilapiae]GHC58267.1 hypothetical protein GCM10007315_22340 [Gemmobacter tilapiae]